MYSELLTFMLGLDREGKTELLISNVREIYDYAGKKDGISEELLGGLRKLYDHLNMDFKRLSYMASVVDSNLELDIRIQKVSDNLNKKISLLEEEKNKLENNVMLLEDIVSDAKEVKKDLVSIMAIFMAVFSFIQWNFSQFKDLLEYDPFNRLVYVLSVDGILIFSLYCIFAIVDFIIHKDPRMIKPFFNISTKKPTYFGIITLGISILILMGCLYSLKSDTSRKTISKIENSIEETNESLNHEIKKKNVEINILKEKIKELENQIKEINKNDIKLEENTKIKQD
ncbi:hypothetical protein HMPREF0401_01589 [Fusobacterium animalis 11_3_2]|uniref:Uncharacterized protein n=1 Tax=Fusobacterium animalis 11_3_2 TaxID=457403 RepID=F7L168_9FUSO|nr:hypothetical protein [Fusobacterium animalis]EGN66732.1 hypothetical protein HMPREF0401_01589 [Fusobacterium animalis 11_3_2]